MSGTACQVWTAVSCIPGGVSRSPLAVPFVIFAYYKYGLADWIYGPAKWKLFVPAAAAGICNYFLSFAAAVVFVLGTCDVLRLFS